MFAGQGSEEFWVGLDDQLNEGDFRSPAIYIPIILVHAPLQYCGIALLLHGIALYLRHSSSSAACLLMPVCPMMCIYNYRWLHNNSRPTYTNYSEGFTASNNVNLDCVRYTGTGWQLATDFCENIGMPFVCKAPSELLCAVLSTS